jgi:hypothetical protein
VAARRGAAASDHVDMAPEDAWRQKMIASIRRASGGNVMPKMSDSRRKRIQAKQRKATNALQRATKLAKRKRNASRAG